MKLLTWFQAGQLEMVPLVANRFLEMMAEITVGWLLLEGAVIADEKAKRWRPDIRTRVLRRQDRGGAVLRAQRAAGRRGEGAAARRRGSLGARHPRRRVRQPLAYSAVAVDFGGRLGRLEVALVLVAARPGGRHATIGCGSTSGTVGAGAPDCALRGRDRLTGRIRHSRRSRHSRRARHPRLTTATTTAATALLLQALGRRPADSPARCAPAVPG